jgi:Protein of unknown function (DUF742)
MVAPKDSWLDDDAGPLVRSFFVAQGRTLPTDGTAVGLIDVVVTTGQLPPDGLRLTPEHRQLLAQCRQPVTVVDLASEIDLPSGVVRMLLTDLAGHGMLRILKARRGPVTDQRILRDVLDGLQAL